MSHCLLLLLIVRFSTALATIHFVERGESIQDIVVLAGEHDTVIVADGVYEETIVAYGKDLTLASQYLLDGDTTHISETRINGTDSRIDTSSALVLAYRETASFRVVGLTFSGQSGTRWNVDDPESFGGGAIYVFMSGITLEHCRIVESQSMFGGGLLIAGNWSFESSKGVIQDCVFHDCKSSDTGGAAYVRDCSLRVARTVFVCDSSIRGCPGLRVTRSCAEVHSCLFMYCNGGNGALQYANNIGSIRGCVFEQNSGQQIDDFTDLSLNESHALCTGCVFRNNASTHTPIGIFQAGIPMQFVGNVIEGTRALFLSGTMLVADRSWGEIAYNIIHNNENISGGAVFCINQSHPRIHHNVFTENMSTNGTDASAVAYGNAWPSLDSNIIAGNFGPSIGVVEFPALRAIRAEQNWWGDRSGPYHVTRNPGGTGDTLTGDSIQFSPWLTEPPDTTISQIGGTRPLPGVAATWQFMEVFPNPFNREISLTIAGFAGEHFRISLYNILGEVVQKLHEGPVFGGSLKFRASAELSSGIYLVCASDQSTAQTRKVFLLK